MYILPGALAPLGQYRQFIIVRLKPATDERGVLIPGKLAKYPAWPHDQPTTNANGVQVGKWGMVSAHRPDAWLDWQTAAALAAIGPTGGDTVGWTVGFVLTENDPIGVYDLDACATIAGTWNDNAQEIMRRMPAAIELSLSGQGLHGWFTYQGKAPPHGKRNQLLNIEMYTEGRFIALGTAASGQMYDLTAHLPQFIADYFPYSEEAECGDWTDGPVPEHTVLSDEDLLRLAMSSQRKQDAESVFGGGPMMANFADLWNANVPVLARCYPPLSAGKPFGQTEADLALAKELAYWTGKDCERIARLMHMSGLKRDKWSPSVHKTYFRDTVLKGVAFCTAVYKAKSVLPNVPPAPPTGGKLEPVAITHGTFIGRENLAAIFKDCVYIQDQNAVLIPNGDIIDQSRFNAKYAGYTFIMDNEGQKTTKSAWEAFLGNQLIMFPRVEGTEFNPRLEFQHVVERAGRRWINVYKAPIVERRPGDVKPFMDLLHKLLPNGDDALILLSYMAAVVQYPGVKFRWAPFIQGTQGNGKSTLVECLRHALGHKYVFTIKTGMIENNFNAWLENNLLYIADDIYSAKDRTDMMESLKSLITERDHAITLKGIDSLQKRICGNFMFTDNHKDAMKKQDDTRRICTLYCAQQSKWDRQRDGLTKEYFGGFLYPWLENGGYAHVADLLATMPIDPRYNPAGECQEAPETSVTREAVIDGRDALEHEIAEWIVLREPGFAGDFVSHHMLKARMAQTPQFSKMTNPIKIKEKMMRLGYEQHRALPEGRVPVYVQPDNTMAVLYVKRDSPAAEMKDPHAVAALYQQLQQEAQTEQTTRRFAA